MAFSTLPQLDRSALLALLDEQPDDVLQTLCRTIAQAAISAEFDEQIGVESYGRSEGRNGYRNGTRSRTLNTRLGTLDPQIPRPREGGYVPFFLEERKRSERALVATLSPNRSENGYTTATKSENTRGRRATTITSSIKNVMRENSKLISIASETKCAIMLSNQAATSRRQRRFGRIRARV